MIVLDHIMNVATYIQPLCFGKPRILMEYPYKSPSQNHHEERHSLHQTGAMVSINLWQEITRPL